MQELLEKKLASSLFVKLVFKIQENIFHISNGYVIVRPLLSIISFV